VPEPQPEEKSESSTATSPERRAWVRYGVDLDATCHPPGDRKEVGWPGQVRDVSAGGIGLVMRHCFRPGTPLLVEVHGETGECCRVLPVRVVHATPINPGAGAVWLVGCAFLDSLSEYELRLLLHESGRG
jgi:hypothetical protein